VPDSQAAGATGRADVVEVESFTVVRVLIASAQLAVHVGPRDILAPGVDARTGGRLSGLERMAIDAMRGLVVLPEQVVVTIVRQHHHRVRRLVGSGWQRI